MDEESEIFNPTLDIKNFRIPEYNESLIEKCITDLFINPRKTLHEWSCITGQTNHTKVGYTGQHLASVIINTRGCKTGARGQDCADGTEVKSCSRVDQSDKCNRCKINILRLDAECPSCKQSDKIARNNDSKWLLAIRSQKDVDGYLNLDRLLFIIEDYPEFDKHNYNDIQITVYEIYPKKNICKNFQTLIKSYYSDIYLKNLKKHPNKIPAPKNIWPYSFQFYMCNPIEIFKCRVKNYLTQPAIEIIKFIRPNEPRRIKDIAQMPVNLLNPCERKTVDVTNEYVSLQDRLKLELR